MNKATCNKVWLAAIAFIFAVLMAGGSMVNVHAAEPAQTDVKIDTQNFPDETFRKYVTQPTRTTLCLRRKSLLRRP